MSLEKHHYCCYDTVILCREILYLFWPGSPYDLLKVIFPGIDHPNCSVTQEPGNISHLNYTLENRPAIKSKVTLTQANLPIVLTLMVILYLRNEYVSQGNILAVSNCLLFLLWVTQLRPWQRMLLSSRECWNGSPDGKNQSICKGKKITHQCEKIKS